MPDPIITPILTVLAVEGVKQASSLIQKMIYENKDEAVKKSLSEMRDLIRILDERITKVEEKVFIENMKEADVHYLLQKSLKSVSNFPNEYKTALISELIIQRLLNPNQNTTNNILSVCAEKLEFLSVKHIKLLSVLYALGLHSLYENFFEELVKELGLKNLTPTDLSNKVAYLTEDINVTDFNFLMTTGCIDVDYKRTLDFKHAVLYYAYAREYDNIDLYKFRADLLNTPIGEKLSKQELRLGSVLLNSISLTIGKESFKVFSKIFNEKNVTI